MISSSILNSVTFKKLATYPTEFPNMWNTLHADRKHSNNLIIPYFQKFNKNHVLYLQFESDTDATITLKSFYKLPIITQIESISAGYTSHYGSTNMRYYTNFVVTLDSDYFDKHIYFTAIQGSDVLTSEPVLVTDLTEQINKGTIKYIKYSNLDRIESDLDNRFIDWSVLANTGNYLDFYIEAMDVEVNDIDKSEVLEGSQSNTILSASYYTGKVLKIAAVPDYMIAKIGMVSNLDLFTVNSIQYIKKSEIDPTLFGNSTSFQATLKLSQKNAIGINVDNLGIIESNPIIPDITTKMYVGAVTNNPPYESEVKAMTELLAVKEDTTIQYYNELGTRNCFAYPASFGELSSILMWNVYDLMSAFEKTQATFTFGSNSVLMNIYTFVCPITYAPEPATLLTLTYKF